MILCDYIHLLNVPSDIGSDQQKDNLETVLSFLFIGCVIKPVLQFVHPRF